MGRSKSITEKSLSPVIRISTSEIIAEYKTFGRVLDLLFVGAASLPPAYVRAARSRPYDVQSNIFGTLPNFLVIFVTNNKKAVRRQYQWRGNKFKGKFQ